MALLPNPGVLVSDRLAPGRASLMRTRGRGGLSVSAVSAVRVVLGVLVSAVGSVGSVRRGDLRIATGAARVALVGRAVPARMGAARAAMRGFVRAGAVRRAVRVRAGPVGAWPEVGNPRDCGRVSWALESWGDLPGPWAAVVVPAVGYVGRSMAVLAMLRGASVEWQGASGRVLVGGQILIGDDGRPVLVGSDALALSVVLKGADALESAIGAAATRSGVDREKRMNAIRKGQRGTVVKGARWVGHASLSPGQSRALQAEFNWRERRL